jgi:hypothetical protein
MILPEYVTINGTNYATSKLSDAAKAQVVNVRVVDAEIARLQQLIAIAQTARNAYSNALLEEMKVKDETPAEKPKKARKSKTPKAE